MMMAMTTSSSTSVKPLASLNPRISLGRLEMMMRLLPDELHLAELSS